MQHADEEDDINKVMRFVYQGISLHKLLCHGDKTILTLVLTKYNLRKLLHYVFSVIAGAKPLFMKLY